MSSRNLAPWKLDIPGGDVGGQSAPTEYRSREGGYRSRALESKKGDQEDKLANRGDIDHSESWKLFDHVKLSTEQWMAECTTPSTLRRRFEDLKSKWVEESGHLSGIRDISTLMSYQQIIGMGPPVVPIILEDMKKSPDHWFWALEAITGNNPIPADEYGNIKKMTSRWIEWGVKKNLIR